MWFRSRLQAGKRQCPGQSQAAGRASPGPWRAALHLIGCDPPPGERSLLNSVSVSLVKDTPRHTQKHICSNARALWPSEGNT